MASEFTLQQSRVVLNASKQDHTSISPTPSEMITPTHSSASQSQHLDDEVQVPETNEIVEDSFKGDYAIRPPELAQMAAAGDEDANDLCSVSPETKSRHDAAMLSNRNPHESSVEDSKRHPLAQEASQKGPRSQGSSLKLFDTAAPTNSARKRTQAGDEVPADEAGAEFAQSDSKHINTSGPQTRIGNTSGARNPPTMLASDSPRRPQRAAKRTAATALQSRRDGRHKASGFDGPAVQPAPEPGFSKDLNVMGKTRASQLPTPLTNGAAYREQETRPSKGKLPTHKVKTNAAVPSATPAKQPRVSKREAAAPASSGEYDATRGQKRPRDALPKPATKKTAAPKAKTRKSAAKNFGTEDAETEDEAPAKPPGMLKRPSQLSAGKQLKNNADDVWDVPDVSDERLPTPKRGKRGISKAMRPSTALSNTGGQTRRRMQVDLSPRRDDIGSRQQPESSRSRPKSRAISSAIQSRDQDKQKQTKSMGRRQEADSPDRAADVGMEVSDELSHQRATNPHHSHNAIQPNHPGKAVEPHGPRATAAPVQQPARGSQQNPIEFSKVVDTSSIASGPPAAEDFQATCTGQDQDTSTKERYRTPAFMPSSPPYAQTKSRQALESRKAVIIGFDRSGPRNQGSERLSKFGANIGSLVRSQATPLFREASGQTKASVQVISMARSHCETMGKAAYVQAKANVANRNESILGIFGLSDEAAASDPHQNYDYTERPMPLKPEELELGLQRSAGSKHQAVRNEAGTQHEKPKHDDAGEGDYDDLDGTILIEGGSQLEGDVQPPTASQTAMPPPMGKGRNIFKAQPAPTMPTMDVVRSQMPMPASTNNLPKQLKHNLETAPGAGGQFVAKRIKIGGEMTALQARAAEPGMRSKKAAIGDSPLSQPPQTVPFMQPHRAIRRQSKRLSRQPSQATVDGCGSPVPKNFELPALATVLETFAQQKASVDRTGGKETPATVHQDAVITPLKVIQCSLPPVHKSRNVASQTKLHPADPGASPSTYPTRMSRDVVDQLVKLNQREPLTDPFTSSKDGEEVSSSLQHKSAFMEAMQHQGIANVEGEVRGASGGHEIGKNRDGHRPDTQDEHENQENEDPDKTLVESEAQQPQAPKRRRRKSSESAGTPFDPADSADSEYDSMSLWREALKPHQMTLFDSLVVVSHKLVRTLVDQETAMKDMVNDYRKQGETIVAKLEESHAKTYQELLQQTSQKKREVADKFAKGSRRLRRSMRVGEHEHKTRVRSMESTRVIEDRLSSMMDVICG